ncbi:MAG: methionyl-tRNA formyltransferase [Clostridia bacterium]|nr:methionyl-tRNA formyltransferase [Clostridia bacterium]MDE7329042.1 methionyl-tRNA formyltransferase [Clostridia bacterium]
MRILFLGTPDFAVSALSAILENGYDVVGVVTQPDRKRNRGEATSFSPVKSYALQKGIEVYQYESIKKEGVEDIKNIAPDVMITCAFGQIISQEILDIPKYGVLNIHASLLPKYRGSSPIQRCLINGEKTTGVTIMKTALAVDSGDILLQKEIDILPEENAGELFDRLAILGGEAIVEALGLLEKGEAKFTPQDEKLATHYPMISKEDGRIDWSASAIDIFNKMRGFTPWPSAFTYLTGKLFKISRSRVCKSEDIIDVMKDFVCGEAYAEKTRAFVKTGEGVLELLEVQIEGKKAMDVSAFLQGGKLKSGEILG